MGFFDMFKKKEQKQENKDALANLLQQSTFSNPDASKNTAPSTQQTYQSLGVQSSVQNAQSLPLPPIPTFNSTVVSTSKPQEVIEKSSEIFQNSNVQKQNTVKSSKEEELVKEKIEGKENMQTQYYFYKANLFVEAKYYEKLYNYLLDSQEMLQNYKKVVDITLERQDLEIAMKNYYDSLDEMNRILFKLDKSLFED